MVADVQANKLFSATFKSDDSIALDDMHCAICSLDFLISILYLFHDQNSIGKKTTYGIFAFEIDFLKENLHLGVCSYTS